MPRPYKTTTIREDSKSNLDDSIINGTVEQMPDVDNVNDRSTSNFEDRTNNISSIMNFASNAVGLIVTLSAIFGAIGFLIVNIYLSIASDIHGFSVVPGRYVSASIWALIVFVAILFFARLGWIFHNFKPFSSHIFGIIIQLLSIFSILIFVIVSSIDLSNHRSNLTTIRHLELRVLIGYIGMCFAFAYILRDIKFGTASTRLLVNLLSFLFSATILIIFTVLILLTPIILFLLTYPTIPQYLGGGKPAMAQLVLEENDITKQLPLGFISGTYTTEPIAILSELTDGLLIQDANGNTIVIKSEHIGAILDIQPTTTPMPAVSSTATTTPTVMLTATPTP